METTHLRIARLSEEDAAFDPAFADADAERLLAVAPFKDMSLPADQLRRILQNHCRVRRFRSGEIVVRSGDYGSSAFLVLSGSVRVVLQPGLPESMLGRREARQRSIWRVIAQLWSSSAEPEVRKPAALAPIVGSTISEAGEVRVFLQDVPRILSQHKTATLGEEEFFGEIAALSRMPRTASIFAESGEVELLEVRWQGLKALLADQKFQHRIDDLYRKNVLSSALRAIPLFQHLSEAQHEVLKSRVEFGTFGSYGWSGEYKKLAQKGTLNPEIEQLIAGQNTAAAGLFIVRSGFARLTRSFGAGQRTLNYLGAGQIFGLREVLHNWQRRGTETPLLLYQGTLRALGYTHTLFVPREVLEELVLPGLPPALRPAAFTAEELAEDDEDPSLDLGAQQPGIGPEMMEFLTANRIFNGTATMAIDLDRCTRCDDCVRACAATHGNNPRFLRHGPSSGRIQIAQACMHCVDPVCMIGCPTGAIHRDSRRGNVVINQATCIGCSTCSNQCPYEAIRMVEVRNAKGAFVTDESLKPILKATKCDLCLEQYGGPACERACPHDALRRIDMTSLDRFARWINP